MERLGVDLIQKADKMPECLPRFFFFFFFFLIQKPHSYFLGADSRS